MRIYNYELIHPAGQSWKRPPAVFLTVFMSVQTTATFVTKEMQIQPESRWGDLVIDYL